MVYCDDFKAKVRIGIRTYIFCHMIADTDKELHRMAAKIGVDRKWFQDKGYRSHYDICKSKRVLAIYHGAKSITRRECVKIVMTKRKQALQAVLKEDIL